MGINMVEPISSGRMHKRGEINNYKGITYVRISFCLLTFSVTMPRTRVDALYEHLSPFKRECAIGLK